MFNHVSPIGVAMVPPNTTVYAPEYGLRGAHLSGGEFRNCFAMPEYQKTVVDYYLTNRDYYPNYPADIWNSTGQVRSFSHQIGIASE